MGEKSVKFTKEFCIEVINEIYKEYGVLKNNQLIELLKETPRYPSLYTIQKRLGLYKKKDIWAIAGVDEIEVKKSSKSYSDEELKTAISRYYKEFNKVPYAKDMDIAKGYPLSSTITQRLNKTWGELLEDNGFNANRSYANTDANALTDKELLGMLDDFFKTKTDRISRTDYDATRPFHLPSGRYLIERFNMSWSEIVSKIGHTPATYNAEQTLEKILELSKDLGKAPSVLELKESGYSENPLITKFGTYNNALKSVGLEPLSEPVELEFSKDEILVKVKDLANKMGTTPRLIDIEAHLGISTYAIFTHFGSVAELHKATGLDPIRASNLTFTKEYCRQVLLEINKEYGDIPIAELKDILRSNENYPSLSTIQNRFNTRSTLEIWDEVLK